MRKPYYGELGAANLASAVRVIWHSRNDELPLCEPYGWSWEQTNEFETHIEAADMVRKIIAVTPLTQRESTAIKMHFFYGNTLDEIGRVLGVTRERTRQILNKGVRRMRLHQKKITGINTWDRENTLKLIGE